MKKLLLLLAVIAFGGLTASAQDEDAKIYRSSVSLVPQYTIVSGLRIDIDKPISKDKLQWLSFSPQVYVSWNSTFAEYDEMWGLGLDVKHRVYLNRKFTKPEGFYFQYGPGFQFFSINDNREYFESYIEDGNEYLRITTGEITTKLFKVGGNLHLGYQSMIGDKVLVDFYLGSGIRLSFDDRNDGLHPWYNDLWISPGYSGTLLDAGMRIGIAY